MFFVENVDLTTFYECVIIEESEDEWIHTGKPLSQFTEVEYVKSIG